MADHLEEIYMVLYGASNSYGVKYDVILKWFNQCAIIDGRFLTDTLFNRSYERLCPNFEDLSLVQFIQLMGILARETRQDLELFVTRFRDVERVISDEVVESRRGDDYRYS